MLVKNTTFGVKEAEFINQEIAMDNRIEEVVRTIQEKAIVFYNEYKNLNNLVQNSTNALAEVKKLKNCSVTLTSIKDICNRELDAFAKRKKEFMGGPAENKYLQALEDLSKMISDLNSYIENLNNIAVQIEAGMIRDPEIVKRGFKLFGSLQEWYDAFIKSDEKVIVDLTKIRDVSGRSN